MPQNANHIPIQPEAAKNPFPELEVRSEPVQEIIGRPPHWLVRWGITAFFGVFGLVLLSASIIKYPEVVHAPLKLTAIHAPQSLESRINGKVVYLNVENGDNVEEGEILAWIESTADHRQVLKLSSVVDSLQYWILNDDQKELKFLSLSEFNILGELQGNFQSFEQSYREFNSYLAGGFYYQQQELLGQELDFIRQLLDQLNRQKEVQQNDYELAHREYEMQKQLAENDFIAPIELTRVEQELSARMVPLRQTESSIINNHMTRVSKQKELMELNRRIEEQTSVFLQELNHLKSFIADWKMTYLLRAPFQGRAIYAGIIQENQSLTSGQQVFYIQPDNTRFFGELSVSQQSFGKIREGQQVMIRFSGYPYHEFGSVYGEVDYFSDFPITDSLFFARVEFPEGLTTNYGRDIQPRNGMTGRAEIITQDMRLLQRVYNNITKELR